jgi:hypothetical protein
VQGQDQVAATAEGGVGLEPLLEARDLVPPGQEDEDGPEGGGAARWRFRRSLVFDLAAVDDAPGGVVQEPAPAPPRAAVAVVVLLVVLDGLEPPLSPDVRDQRLDQVQVDLVGVLASLVLLEGLGGPGGDIERGSGGS